MEIIIIFFLTIFISGLFGFGIGLFIGAAGDISKEEDAYRRGWEAGFRKGKATPASKGSVK